jgi:hypothetical protein
MIEENIEKKQIIAPPDLRHATAATRKEYYLHFCKHNPQISLFLQPQWLQTVRKDDADWQVCLSQDTQGNINGVLICYETKLRKMIPAIILAELTPHSGIWIRPQQTHPVNGLKLQQRYHYEKQILENLLDQLDQRTDIAIHVQHLAPNVRDWQPFHWRGYKQTTHYTYILPDISDLSKVYGNLKGSIRTDIKKANNTVKIKDIDDTNILYDLLTHCLKVQKRKHLYSRATLHKVYTTFAPSQTCDLLAAIDAEGKAHAAVLVVYDGNTAHYLAGGSDPDLRKSSAMNALIWAAIERAHARGIQQFDFQGSMIESVEKVFRAFGGVQTPFFRITKTKNRFYELLTLFFSDYK